MVAHEEDRVAQDVTRHKNRDGTRDRCAQSVRGSLHTCRAGLVMIVGLARAALHGAEAKKQTSSVTENRSGPLYSIIYSQIIKAHVSKTCWWASPGTRATSWAPGLSPRRPSPR